jgi:signal transduction histidine kinase
MNLNPHIQIDMLLSEAKTLRWTNYNRLIEVSEEALKLAREIDDLVRIAACLNYIAWGYNRLESSHQAIKYAREAFRITKQHDLLEQFGYALSNMAYCYGNAGEIHEALQLIEQQIAIAEENNFVELQAFGYNDISVYYISSREYSTAIDLLERIIRMIDEHQLDLPKSFPYLNMADIYLNTNDIAKSIEYSMMAYKESVKAEFILGKIYSEQHLSNIYYLKGDGEKALHYAQRSYQTAVSIGYDLISPQYFISQAYSLQERFDEALEGYHKIEETVLANTFEMINLLYTAMSDLYAKKGNYEQAYEYLLKARDSYNHHANEEANKRIAILKTRYELDTMQREAQFQQAQMLVMQSEMEERIRRQRAEVTLEKQRELVKIKNHILTRLNHEFRTPLSILRMSFELLTRYEDRLTEENKGEHTRRIEEQFSHINILLDDVLDALQFNPIIQKDLMITPIRIRYLGESAIETAEQRTRTSGRVQMNVDLVEETIYQNENLIEQIMVNLLTNAIKFSQDKVMLNLSVDEKQLTIQVSDQGIGIPPEEQESVFEVLTRGSNLDEIGGNGIGLALIKQSVEALQGKITLESTLNVGTIVTVILPLKETQHPQETRQDI